MYPATRPPLRRIMEIDHALRTGGWPNCSTLAQELEVDPRTIQRDMDFMRDQLRAPIDFDPVRNGYFYTETTYCLPYVQFSEGELLALYLADRIARQFQGTPYETDLRRAIDKLSIILPDVVSIRLDEIADFLSVLPASQSHYDPHVFCALSTAVARHRQVDMLYWTAGRNETNQRLVDPYGLAWGDDGWFVVGYCHLRVAMRTFAIQRVRTVHETGETFDIPADFRVEDYMRGSFRAVRGDGDYHVVLRFVPELAPRIAEKQWHSSQILEPQPDDSLVARYHLSSLVEVKHWVMRWEGGCRVLEPRELREAIIQEARDILRRENAENT
jgi:predicted DNA-binding transcriptional regulator YafY